MTRSTAGWHRLAVILAASGLAALAAPAVADTLPDNATASGGILTATTRSIVSTAPVAKDTKNQVTTVGQVVVKITSSGDIHRINQTLGSTTRSTLLASRGIYLLDLPLSVDEKDPAKVAERWASRARDLLHKLDQDTTIVYAEPNTPADIADSERLHIWPYGQPSCIGTDPALYDQQAAAIHLNLAAVHRTARGTGQIIAVLDTGYDPTQPALAPHVINGGYDYIDDDNQPYEERTGTDLDGDQIADEGYGHGTFVMGVAELVAPDAHLLPMRVLDPDGRGNVFTTAEAIYDAVSRGATVINMSFGTVEHTTSRVLQDAIKHATKAGVTIVAAGGNDGLRVKHYPAAMDGVISVAALASNETQLATFSASGDWITVAAPGEDIVSTLPCGYGSWSGTSVAAPFVAGMAALLAGSTPKVRQPDKMRNAIQGGADHLPQPGVHSGAIDILRSLSKL